MDATGLQSFLSPTIRTAIRFGKFTDVTDRSAHGTESHPRPCVEPVSPKKRSRGIGGHR